jgi:hypothetical protein
MIEELQRDYALWIEQMRMTTDLFDDESRAVRELKAYVQHQRIMIDTTATTPKDKEKRLLRIALLQKLDDPFLTPKESEALSKRFNVSERSIRDFFRNQRLRIIKRIKEHFQDEVDIRLTKIEELDPFIVTYIADFAIHEREPFTSPEIGPR